MYSIGIGITTRNRPEFLELTLKHFKEFLPKNYEIKFIVVDDKSEVGHHSKNIQISDKYGFELYHTPSRKGIAGAKNICLSYSKDCDYIFLFDDDCFPRKKGWVDLYIDTYKKTGVNHLMYLVELGDLKIIKSNQYIDEYHNCGGVMLFLTQEVIKKVGGYDSRFGIYGYEHAQYSRRIYDAGLQNGNGKYLAPKNCEEYIYSIDLDYGWKKKQPPLGMVDNTDSSIIGENVTQYISENGQYFANYGSIYKPL